MSRAEGRRGEWKKGGEKNLGTLFFPTVREETRSGKERNAKETREIRVRRVARINAREAGERGKREREAFNRRHVESIGNRRRVVGGGEKGEEDWRRQSGSTVSSSKGDPVTDGIKRLAELCISFGNGVRDRELNIPRTTIVLLVATLSCRFFALS